MNTNTYTIQQYAAYKNVSVNTIRNWIKQKKVNATKKDNQWFITAAAKAHADAVGETIFLYQPIPRQCTIGTR